MSKLISRRTSTPEIKMTLHQTLVSFGKMVILDESRALAALAESLGDNFDLALKILLAPGRRIAVSGVGKSGHIGRKISATFSSTGTPSYFIHPAEASHGDMGMLGTQDALLAISNSGKSRELLPLTAFCQSMGIPIIAITHERESTLAKMADVSLLLNYEAEAGPFGIAPTTSATETAALGDALAMCLMKAKGFCQDDFRRLHPGGWLGMRIRRVEEIMRTGPMLPLVDPDMPVSNVLLEITLKKLGCALVVNTNGELLGIITDGDLRRHMDRGLMQRTAAEIMHEDPAVISPVNTVGKAMYLMNSRKITSLPVMANSTLLGIIHLHDCLNPEDSL